MPSLSMLYYTSISPANIAISDQSTEALKGRESTIVSKLPMTMGIQPNGYIIFQIKRQDKMSLIISIDRSWMNI
jgi:hypothetical protein